MYRYLKQYIRFYENVRVVDKNIIVKNTEGSKYLEKHEITITSLQEQKEVASRYRTRRYDEEI